MTATNSTPDQAAKPSREAIPKSIWSFYIGAGLLLLSYWVLSPFDDFTELTPAHDGALLACFAVAGLCALSSVLAALYLAKSSSPLVKVRLSISILILGFLAVFLAGSRLSDLVNGAMDFPSAKTRSMNALLLISRAYQTHGKGRSWNIQTMPIWSNLDITEHDYQFMLAHRRPGDDSHNPDDISSKGYFCARVTIERSGSALRVMHAGSHALPAGAVIVCPAMHYNPE